MSGKLYFLEVFFTKRPPPDTGGRSITALAAAADKPTDNIYGFSSCLRKYFDLQAYETKFEAQQFLDLLHCLVEMNK